jgi:hypothetical protein
MPAATTQTFSMRVDSDLLASIDHNATQAGMNRTEYVLSWLPDTYQHPSSETETTSKRQRSTGR